MKILILTASTGGGHRRASQALMDAIVQNDSSAVVKVSDALEFCGHRFNKTVSEGYHYMATKTPKIYGRAYRLSDNDNLLNSLVAKINAQMSIRLLPLIAEFKPDCIVTCHPFAAKMMAVLKRKRYITAPIIAIITDFAGHRAYMDEHVDKYVVATDDMIGELVVKYNISQEKIYSLGIPINKEFYEIPDKETILNNLGFSQNLPIILIMAGSFGVTDILQIYENLLDLKTPHQIIVITGKNKRLYDAFEKMLNKDITEFEYLDNTSEEIRNADPNLKRRRFSEFTNQISDITGQIKDTIKETISDTLNDLPFNIGFVKKYIRTTTSTKPTKLFYFVDNVQDYMHISDLLITKPGGLTVSESLASGLPLAVFRAFPGQEADNADYLIRRGMAISIGKGRSGARQVEEILTDREKLALMKRNCLLYYKKESAKNIYLLICKTIENEQ